MGRLRPDERNGFLEARLADPDETRNKFLSRFLRPALHNARHEEAFGTLYTAVYRPGDTAAEYRWPRRSTLHQSFPSFEEGETIIGPRLPTRTGKLV